MSNEYVGGSRYRARETYNNKNIQVSVTNTALQDETTVSNAPTMKTNSNYPTESAETTLYTPSAPSYSKNDSMTPTGTAEVTTTGAAYSPMNYNPVTTMAYSPYGGNGRGSAEYSGVGRHHGHHTVSVTSTPSAEELQAMMENRYGLTVTMTVTPGEAGVYDITNSMDTTSSNFYEDAADKYQAQQTVNDAVVLLYSRYSINATQADLDAINAQNMAENGASAEDIAEKLAQYCQDTKRDERADNIASGNTASGLQHLTLKSADGSSTYVIEEIAEPYRSQLLNLDGNTDIQRDYVVRSYMLVGHDSERNYVEGEYQSRAEQAASQDATTVPERGSWYKIKPGDTLSGIAASVSGGNLYQYLDQICERNDMSINDTIYPGQEIYLP